MRQDESPMRAGCRDAPVRLQERSQRFRVLAGTFHIKANKLVFMEARVADETLTAGYQHYRFTVLFRHNTSRKNSDLHSCAGTRDVHKMPYSGPGYPDKCPEILLSVRPGTRRFHFLLWSGREML